MTAAVPSAAPIGSTEEAARRDGTEDGRPPPGLRVVVAACGCVAVLAVLAATATVGALAPDGIEGLPDAGAVVAATAPLLRLAATVAGVLVVGLLLTRTVLAPGTSGGARAVVVLAGSWAAVAWGLAAATVHEIAAVPPGGLRPSDVLTTAWTLGPTRAWLVTGVLAAGVLVVASTGRSGLPALALALVALVVPVYSGHAAGMPDHAAATGALVVHVLAAALWAGGLAGLGLLVVRRSTQLPRAARRFSPVALGCVVALGLSGLVSAVAALGTSPTTWSSPYGALVLTKTVLLVLLVACGAAHRRWTLARLADGGAQPFVRLVTVELVVMAATAGVATALARTAQAEAGDVVPVLPALLGWRPDPLLLAVTVLAGTVGVVAFRRGPSGSSRTTTSRSRPGRGRDRAGGVVVVLVAALAAGLPPGAAVPRVVLLAVVVPVLLTVLVRRVGPVAVVCSDARTASVGAPPAALRLPGTATASAVLVLAVVAAARPPELLARLPAPAHLVVPGLALLAGGLLAARLLEHQRTPEARSADLTAAGVLTAALGTAVVLPVFFSAGAAAPAGTTVVDGAALLGGAAVAVLAARWPGGRVSTRR